MELVNHGRSQSSEATYGVDNCGANWKEQALKKQHVSTLTSLILIEDIQK